MRSSTGPSREVRAAVAARSSGLCERCGRARAEVIHHRRPRKMGGSKASDTNTLPNLAHLCNLCHLEVESLREHAADLGWLVPADTAPATVPVLYRGELAWLRPDGGIDLTEYYPE